jgi:general secretion pathway protein E
METKSNTFHAPELSSELQEALLTHSDLSEPETTHPWAEALLRDAIKGRASDIHLDPQTHGIRIRFRIDGAVQEVATLVAEPGLRLARYFKVHSGLDPAASRLPEDAHFQYEIDGKPLDIRLACAPCVLGDKLALRLLKRAPVALRLRDLGLREEDRALIEGWLGDISGMFLVAGPVGSGKTTTLYSLLAELHLNQRNIVTVEDPVEYQLEKINQIEVDVKRGLTFEQGLRSILRLDADYILLGEIRDKESAVAAMEAAATGRVVLTTIHSRNAAGAITALRSLGLPNYEIAASVAFVVAQRLVRKLCLQCRRLEPPTDAERRLLEASGMDAQGTVWHAKGCDKCRHTGFYERTGIFEVLPVDERVYDLILEAKDEHGLRQHLRSTGFHPLLRDGLKKAAAGITTISELMRIGAQSYLERAMRGSGKAQS